MRSRKQQSGFALIGVLLAVIVLAAVAFAGWRVYQAQHTDSDSKSSASNSQPRSLRMFLRRQR